MQVLLFFKQEWEAFNSLFLDFALRPDSLLSSLSFPYGFLRTLLYKEKSEKAHISFVACPTVSKHAYR